MIRFISVVVIVFFIYNAEIQAGAWTQSKSGYFFKIEASYLKAFQEFNHKGEKLNILEEQFIYKDAFFRDISIRAYAEYGLLNDLTVTGKVPFKIYTTQYFLDDLYSQGEVSKSTVGLGDFELGLKYGLLEQPFAISVQGGIKIPLGYKKHPDNEGPRLGTGEIDFESVVLLGQSLYPLPIYISCGLGYRSRSGPLHDEIIYHIESGYILDQWFFKLYFNGLKNTETPPDLYGGEIQLPLPGGGGVTPDILYGDQDLNQISLAVSFEFEKGKAIEAAVYNIISGKNTVSGNTFSIGLSIYN